MDRKQVRDSIIDILIRYTMTPKAQIEDLSFIDGDLNIQGSDLEMAISDIQEKFEVELPEEDMSQVDTVDDLVDLVLMKKEESDG